MRVPEEVGFGNAKVTLSFAAWKEGNVASATLQIPVVKDAPQPPQPPPVEGKTPADPKARPRASIVNDLRQVGIAFHSYMDKHGHFTPAAISSKDGKALLSWRVALLPFLDQEKLYRQFKLDEPWDSEHNKKLLGQMPAVFGKSAEGRTQYRVLTGPGTLFEGIKGAKAGDIRDGFSNTILVIEAKEGTPWTQPEELPYDAKKALPALDAAMGFHILWADGSVERVAGRINEPAFRAAITRAGDEGLDRSKLTDPK